MKTTWLILIAGTLSIFTSCYYRHHMPVESPSDSNPKTVTMTIGERRKIMSKTVLTEISPGFMMGPGYYLRSSDSGVVRIDGDASHPVAWAQAIAPGEARIEYTNSKDGYTPIRVEPKQDP